MADLVKLKSVLQSVYITSKIPTFEMGINFDVIENGFSIRLSLSLQTELWINY